MTAPIKALIIAGSYTLGVFITLFLCAVMDKHDDTNLETGETVAVCLLWPFSWIILIPTILITALKTIYKAIRREL
jgi:hypothetical protein